MPVFPLLADPGAYRACETDLLADGVAREYWLGLFESHFRVQLDAAAACGVSEADRRAAESAFAASLTRVREKIGEHDRLDILVLDAIRRRALHDHGIIDEFRVMKQRENEAAMRALPKRLTALDELSDADRFDALMTGMLAGNLFDMGAKASASKYADRSVPFEESEAHVPPRPWLIDELDAAREAWLAAPPRKSVLFVDNAGADFVLGILPLAREMMRREIEVVVAANSEPSLNDVTHQEVGALLAEASAIESAFVSDRLGSVPSGCIAPLINLSDVSEELVEASADADLIVLVGMGRAVESNFRARFTCASWRVAMLKDPHVAQSLGGRTFDAVFRAERGLAD
jgi:type II pantothenate kinase